MAIIILMSYMGFASEPLDTKNLVPAKNVEIQFSAVSGDVDCSDGVSYEVYWYSTLEEYVVKFFNNTSSYVSITYQYRVKDSSTSSHWRNGYAGCTAGGTSDKNPAGEWGDVRNVEYE
ncbi:MAG: hypothetical protein J6W84_02715 [Bacteroidales bacterium]|nr:hypothetical protein [Bacteroidales bacterium]MBQ7490420.1 hypothetical protein [Bacteroidales bacterium]